LGTTEESSGSGVMPSEGIVEKLASWALLHVDRESATWFEAKIIGIVHISEKL